MRIVAEVYKGIEFIRINNLPVEQKIQITNSEFKHHIIKILKDEIILDDCLQYKDYLKWYDKFQVIRTSAAAKQIVGAREEQPEVVIK